jgi:hypothetical protein
MDKKLIVEKGKHGKWTVRSLVQPSCAVQVFRSKVEAYANALEREADEDIAVTLDSGQIIPDFRGTTTIPKEEIRTGIIEIALARERRRSPNWLSTRKSSR